MTNTFIRSVCFALVTVGLGACANMGEPEVTHDGLVEVQGAKFGTVYAKPGASVEPYTQFALAECGVAFRKNWMRDQNSLRRSVSSKVSESDVSQIRTALAELCNEQFAGVLQRDPAYPVVALEDADDQTLILSPNIINLDVAAPDVQGPGRTQSYTTEAGEMTLFLEVIDASTGEVLYRVVDRRRDTGAARLNWTNSVTNRADAQRILNRWGNQLREGLDQLVAAKNGA